VFYNFKVITLRGAAREGHAARSADLEGASNTLFRHLKKNEFFSRNLGENMPKNAYFF